MNFIKASLIFAVLWLAACSDDGDEIVYARIDENGVQYSPATIQGMVEYLPNMKPSSVRIVNVDEHLNPVDSFEVPVEKTNWSLQGFSVSSHDFKYPLVKIITVFPYGEKSKMEFSQYYRLDWSNYKISQNIYMALVAERIEYLMESLNLNFSDAQDSALQEVSDRFGISQIKSYEISSKNTINFKDLLVYVLCRHEISDSVFYSDFQKLRKLIAKTGYADSSMLLTAADAWLSTFKNVVYGDSSRVAFVSVSRDTAVGLREFEPEFFSQAYGIKLTKKNADTVEIENKSSAYNGELFFKDNESYDSYYDSWRMKMPIEDTLGLCLIRARSIVEYKGNEYLCKNGSNIWKKNVGYDELLVAYYGSCGSSYKKGEALYVRDSLFICECESYNDCAWSDKYAGKDVPTTDSVVYAKYVEARATAKFGRCYNSDYGDRKKLDSLYVQCIRSKWYQVDSLTYYIGHCAKGNTKGEHLGVYYGCLQYADYGAADTVWAEIPEPFYRNVSCTEKEDKKVVEYDGSYFICEKFKKQGANETVSKWRKLDSTEAIPPVVNMDACGVNEYFQKKVYDGKYYECYGGEWFPVKSEDLLPLEKEGFLCSKPDYGLVKSSEGEYYVCNTSNRWEKLDASSAAPYRYQDSLGTCDTITHKTIIWDERSSKFWGCTTVSGKYTWGEVYMSYSPNDSIPDYFDKSKFAGGVVDGDSIYTVTIGSDKYWFKKSKALKFGWMLNRVDISGVAYDAYFYKNNFFIKGKVGSATNQLNLIENKSESFDAFYEDWKARAKDDSECGALKADVDDAAVIAYNFGDGAYMDLEQARQYCPKGFRLLTAEEFMKPAANISTSSGVSQFIWSYEMDGGEKCPGDSAAYNIFWTNDEKDSKTQSCYEYVHFFGRSGYEKSEAHSHAHIIDCPKDLYPMVQTLCIKDR